MDWKVKALARTYLPYTAGVLNVHKFETETAQFFAEYTIDASIKQPTVLYYNYEYWYPNGVTCNVAVGNGNGIVQEWTVEGVDDTNYLNINTSEEEWDGLNGIIQCGPTNATIITA